MFQPEELKNNEPLLWSAGTGTEVWELFCACAAGDLPAVERLVSHNPSYGFENWALLEQQTEGEHKQTHPQVD